MNDIFIQKKNLCATPHDMYYLNILAHHLKSESISYREEVINQEQRENSLFLSIIRVVRESLTEEDL